MALLTVTEAARLARRSRTSIYRDLERGRLDKVYTADGSLKIDSAELARAYGDVASRAPTAGPGASRAATDDAIRAVLKEVAPAAAGEEVAVLRERLAAAEHRIALLERIAQLEKAARLAAEASWRERVQAKDEVIGALSQALSNAARPEDKTWPAWPHGAAAKRAIN